MPRRIGQFGLGSAGIESTRVGRARPHGGAPVLRRGALGETLPLHAREHVGQIGHCARRREQLLCVRGRVVLADKGRLELRA